MEKKTPLSTKIDHLGVAVNDIEAALRVFRDVLGLPVIGQEEVAQDRVRTTFLAAGGTNLELLEALDAQGPVAKFLARRGAGVHHVTFLVDDLHAALDQCRNQGIRLIDEHPRRGAHQALVAFLHPKSTAGILVELKQDEGGDGAFARQRRIHWERLSAGNPPGLVRRGSAAVVMIDVQEKMLPALECEQRSLMMKNLGILLRGAGVLGTPVIATEQYPQGLGKTVAELRELLGGAPLIEKLSFNACPADAFRERLTATGATQVVLTGVETHICVLQTGLGLLQAGYEVHVAGDAVCSRTTQNRRTGIDLLARAGATITSTEAVLFALLERSGTPEFKAIAPLFK